MIVLNLRDIYKVSGTQQNQKREKSHEKAFD